MTKTKRISFEHIVADQEYNTRARYDIESLKESILKDGLLQPIGVCQEGTDNYYLIYGFRRYLAIESIRQDDPGAFAEVTAVILEGTRAALREKNLRENMERTALTTPELADAMSRLANTGKTQEEIASDYGVSQAHVSNLLSVKTNATPKTWAAFRNNELTLDQALDLSSLPEEEQERVLSEAQAVDNRKDAKKIIKTAVKATRKKFTGKTRPTSKNLSQYITDTSFDALSDINTKEQRAFYNGVVAGMKVAVGAVDINALKASEVYADCDYDQMNTPEETDEPVTAKTSKKKPKAKSNGASATA